MRHASPLTSTPIFLRGSLALGLWAIVGCATTPPAPPPPLTALEYTLKVYPTLDLSARQDPNREWLKRLITQTNKHLRPIKVQLSLSEERAWELSDMQKHEPLEALWGTLVRELPTSTAQGDPSPTLPLWLGVNSFPPPSYPKLSQLAVSRRSAPLIILRRLTSLSGLSSQDGVRAMARLLAREIGASLGALKGCEQDTMSLSRDELLGWHQRSPFIESTAARAAPPSPTLMSRTRPTRASNRARALSTEPTREAPLAPLTWSPLNQRLTRLALSERLQAQGYTEAGHCARLQALDLSCQDTLNEARLYTHGCLNSAEAWIEAHARGRLPEAWSEERSLAEGARALKERDWERALQRCAPIASDQPSSFASRCAGEAAAALNKDEEAQRYLRAYLSTHPMSPQVILLLSTVTGRSGDHRAAEALLSELLGSIERLAPLERARALYNLGVARAQLGRLEEAIEAWERVERSGGEYYEKARALLKDSRAP